MPRKHSDNKSEVRKKVRALLPRLRGKRPSTKIKAMQELGALGPQASFTAASLLSFVEDPDDLVRSAAMWALAEIGFGDVSVSKAVRELLTQDTPGRDPYTRSRVYWILEHIECN